MAFIPQGRNGSARRNLVSLVRSSSALTPAVTLDSEIRVAALRRTPVLIPADSRIRREMCARRIHAAGNLGQSPFMVFACGAAGARGEDSGIEPPTPLGDEDARLRQQFDKARGGTFFIDDIATLTHDAQMELCRLLEGRQPARGSTGRGPTLNARVIAGASHHLEAERAAGTFCELLFYRLNVVHIDLMHRGSVRFM